MAHQWNRYTVGVCYYPEHWPEEMWQEDLRRMLANGITVVRIAEFAWSLCEPREGEFTFDYFRRFLDLCGHCGMKVIFGTPTATPPAWLTHKYPEVLNSTMEGTLYRHGGRRHYNYNSPTYRRLCSRIVEKIAEAYGQHPAIVGWQIDNELNCETDEFYSQADGEAFRQYLRKKFGTLENLNRALGTTFWNQTYTDWAELDVPRLTPGTGRNPHMMVEYIRFVSESAISFCEMQAAILRRYRKPGDFITTNGLFASIDNHRMTREALDVYTHDTYPNFAYGLDNVSPEGDLRDRWAALKLIQTRSICPHFGIMEQQSGANGWVNRLEAPAPRPGQMILWGMQSVAHGADYVSFFRWRTCTMGTEIYWHGILDYDSRDNRKLAEVKRFAGMLEKLAPVCGADYTAAFAILEDYDNEWDTRLDAWHRRVYQASKDGLFEATAREHLPYDLVYIDQPDAAEKLQRYPVVVYPHPVMMDQRRADLLRAYVENGGTLLIGCRSGYKDLTGQCVMLPQPGLLQPLTATDVRDFTFTTFAEPESFATMGETRLESPVFNDILTPLEGAQVLATYGESYYKGQAALVENRLGKGRVLHWGSVFTAKNAPALLAAAGVKPLFAGIADAPWSVELALREKDGKRWLFLLNYLAAEADVTLHAPARSMETGEALSGRITLPPYGTLVVELD
ncbi:MAG: beta-galactosidase [Clostridiales bacterium]|nr:beta-galactosidase [Clostridiales bacterium]